MPPLVTCQSLTKAYGARPLFTEITLGIDPGERLGLIGPNGTGKSTLLKIIAGEEKPDVGDVVRKRDLRQVYVAQEDTFPAGWTVEHVLAYAIQADNLEEYERQAEIATVLAKVGFENGDQVVDTLSGGWRKRLALARALVRRPDLLLLDEPTNHLDLVGVLWLEKLLKEAPFAFVLISHDRYFLENVTNAVIELNRAYPEGYLRSQGAYTDFLLRKEEFLSAQAHQQHALEGKVKREIDWLRRGPQARTTKAQYRIDSAHKLIGELADVKYRNSQDRAISVDFSASNRKTKELIVAKGLTKSLGGRTLFRGLDYALVPGAKLGLLGPNGSGKTTLLRLLTGEIEPDSGTIKRAEGLRIVYFDQARTPLDRGVSLRRALSPNGDTVVYQNSGMHVTSWARRFLFRAEQLDMPVGSLSGGEQARILIANLMLQSADVLILDEPTNDLDIPSMEVLEDNLDEFPGAIVLVTHDRYVLDTVSTELLALDGHGGTAFYADYAQWENTQTVAPPVSKSAAVKPAAPRPAAGAPRKLSTVEMRELEQMEETILAAEAAVEVCQTRLSDPAVTSDHTRMQAAWHDLQKAQDRVTALYTRWEELESRRNRG